jgi:hypothetical protein
MKNKSEIELQNYVVTFIDVLGQKDFFKSLEKFSIIDTSTECKNALAHIRKNNSKIKGLRDSFNSCFEGLRQKRPIPNNIPNNKISVYKSMCNSNLKYKSFSDCMQFSTLLKKNEYISPEIFSIFAMLVATGVLLLDALAKKIVVRGGIDIGIGAEIEDGEVYGPASVSAYELESKIAQYPRIVVGKELINHLNALINETPQVPNQKLEDTKYSKELAESCLNLLKEDIDGYFILDYLGDSFRNNFRDRKVFNIFYTKAFNFIESEYFKFKSNKKAKLAQRYFLLYQYFLSY